MVRSKLAGFVAIGALALFIGHGVASAQAQQGAAPDATAGLQRQVNLTPAEELTQSEAVLARMDASRAGVRRQLESARSQRDVVKTLCLNDKLNQVDVAIRSARERRESLTAAAHRADNDLANHEFTIISVLKQRTDQLIAEAQQCIGQEAGFVGDSAVTSTVEPGIPPDPTAWDAPGSNILVTPPIPEPPNCVSCMM
jgi:hypothetical protein